MCGQSLERFGIHISFKSCLGWMDPVLFRVLLPKMQQRYHWVIKILGFQAAAWRQKLKNRKLWFNAWSSSDHHCCLPSSVKPVRSCFSTSFGHRSRGWDIHINFILQGNAGQQNLCLLVSRNIFVWPWVWTTQSKWPLYPRIIQWPLELCHWSS